jgi:hypothetical protein
MSKILDMFKALFSSKCSCNCSSSEECCKTNESDTKKSESCYCTSKESEKKQS